MITFETSCGILTSFVVLFRTDAFKEKFNFLDILVKRFQERVAIVALLVANEIMMRMEVRPLWRRSALKVSGMMISECLELRELGTEQIFQDTGASLAVYTYAMEDSWITELLFHFFCERNFSVTLLNGAA